MKFEKKLIILSGTNDCKGTISIERNAFGVKCALNTYNIPDLKSGQYVLAIKSKAETQLKELGNVGKVSVRFDLKNDTDINVLHCVLFSSSSSADVPLIYGTNDSKKVWMSNMMDGIRSKEVDAKKENAIQSMSENTSQGAAQIKFSGRPKELEKYFLDIFPNLDSNYQDNAIAEINYYPSNLYSTPVIEASKIIDSAIEASENMKTENSKVLMRESISSGGSTPTDYQKSYINSLLSGVKSIESQSEIKKEIPLDNNFIKRYAMGNTQTSTFAVNQSENCRQQNYSAPDKRNTIQGNSIRDRQVVNNSNSIRNMSQNTKNTSYNEVAMTVDSSTNVINGNIVSSIVMPHSVGATPIPPASKYNMTQLANQPEISKPKPLSFYEQVKDQVEKLFKMYPEQSQLTNLMPNTKWVKVDFDSNGKYYVVGIIGSKPDYLCYGVPGKYSSTPPESLDGYCQWFPLDIQNAVGDGFWLMYQDALSGESVKEPSL